MSKLPTPNELMQMARDYGDALHYGGPTDLLRIQRIEMDLHDAIDALCTAAQQGREDSARLEYLIREGWIEASRDEIDRARGVASEVLATGAPSNSED